MIKSGAESLLAIALLSELEQRMGADSASFLIGAGEKIGEACLPPVDTPIEGLEAWMNAMWEQLGLGKVRLMINPRQLVLNHQMPDSRQEARLWREALPALIEGIYRAWLMSLDETGSLTQRRATRDEIEFVYGD